MSPGPVNEQVVSSERLCPSEMTINVTTTVPALVGGRYRLDWEIEDQ